MSYDGTLSGARSAALYLCISKDLACKLGHVDERVSVSLVPSTYLLCACDRGCECLRVVTIASVCLLAASLDTQKRACTWHMCRTLLTLERAQAKSCTHEVANDVCSVEPCRCARFPAQTADLLHATAGAQREYPSLQYAGKGSH